MPMGATRSSIVPATKLMRWAMTPCFSTRRAPLTQRSVMSLVATSNGDNVAIGDEAGTGIGTDVGDTMHRDRRTW